MHKKEYGTVVKNIEHFRPEIDTVNYILIDTTEDCEKK